MPSNKRRKWIVFTSIIVVSSSLIDGLLRSLEPFAARHDGLTVNDWLDFYARENEPLSAEVVDAFGTNAIPVLIKAEQEPKWVNMARFI